jgi:predicted nucleic acid-binding protein
MSGKAFFDTNILLYSMSDDPRSKRAEALLAGGGSISVQVLNEFAAVAHRKMKMPWADIVEAVAAIQTLCPDPVPITVQTHDAALQIAMRYGYHFYDALVLAAALDAGCDTLYSEDLQTGQTIAGRLTIRNPFATR